MYNRITLGGVQLPSYSVCIILGIVLANIVAFVVAKRRKICFETLVLIEVFGGIGAFVGAKLWFQMEVNGLKNLTLDKLLSGGWSSYGGLLAGILTVLIVCRWNHFDRHLYERNFIFLVPVVHMFWKIGCYMAGCCYGVEYGGVFAVQFPENSPAPAGVLLFPVQLLEAILLGGLAVLLYRGGKKEEFESPIIKYVFGYGSIRFFVEFLRYREDRWIFSVSQWIALVAVLLTMGYLQYKRMSIKQGGERCE